MASLTTAAREMHELTAALQAHKEAASAEEIRLRGEIRKRQEVLLSAEAGIDTDKVALAKTVIYATDYSRGGKERASCVRDAIKQLSTGKPIRPVYGDLWEQFFGTKNYSGWVGQRSDHPYGYGPKHGSTCFEVGLTKETRKRDPRVLTAEETEAAIYYLVNLERIQAAEKAARDAANAA